MKICETWSVCGTSQQPPSVISIFMSFSMHLVVSLYLLGHLPRDMNIPDRYFKNVYYPNKLIFAWISAQEIFFSRTEYKESHIYVMLFQVLVALKIIYDSFLRDIIFPTSEISKISALSLPSVIFLLLTKCQRIDWVPYILYIPQYLV